MKIFYAVQATGNGHISRAMEILPHLARYGEVDIFLSGANSTLELSIPVKYRSKGLSLFYNCNGGLNYQKIFQQLSIPRIRQEVKDLPVENYDLVINDFECITSMACTRKKLHSINFGHQASFMSPNTPRPAKISRAGEWILKNYAKATHYAGLHFHSYDHFIYSPIIKSALLNTEPEDRGHITVYLPSYCQPELIQYFTPLKDFRFEIFSWQVKEVEHIGNISFLPVSNKGFTESMLGCDAIICGAGFETPAEALYLGKRMMVMPIKGQYEQQCNAAALQKLDVSCISQLDAGFSHSFLQWITSEKPSRLKYEHSTDEIVDEVIRKGSQQKQSVAYEFLDSAFV